MTNHSMNLLSSPWIPVISNDGSTELVSIQTALQNAKEYVDVASELPSMDFAIRRILLAILYRATDESLAEAPIKLWRQWWESKTLPTGLIAEYLEEFEDKFNLFGDEQPFMQTPGLRTASGDWKPLGVLIPDSPGAGALFNRSNPEEPIDAATAARWLVHANAFDYSGIKSGAVGDKRVKGGKGYPMGIGWSGWLGCTTIKGDNLCETLLLNLVADRQRDDDIEEFDVPLWELDPLPVGERTNAQAWGPVSLMTWPQRRIRLKEHDGLVDGVLICNGDPVDYTNQVNNEFMTPWRYSKPQSTKAKRPVYMPSALQPGRALWRGIESLLPSSSPEKVKSPNKDLVDASIPARNVKWIGALTSQRILPRNYRMFLEVVSVIYGTQNAVIDQVIKDTLTFPSLLATAEGAGLRAIVTTAVQRADAAANALAKLAGNLARAEGGEPASATEQVRKTSFSLIDPMFRTWLSNLSISEVDGEQQLQSWTDELRNLARSEGEDLVRNTSPGAWNGREIDERLYTVGQAEAWFRAELTKVLPKGDKES